MDSTSSSIAELARVCDGRVVGDGSVRVRDATHDSRQSGPGTLFIAVPGSSRDGHEFVSQALSAGSPAVMVEHEMPVAVPQLVVSSTRRAMAPAAAEIHGHPSQKLKLVGVTGTNGKTTVTHMVESIVAAAGIPVGLIGTVHTRVGSTTIPNIRTTPESTDFQRLLATMVRLGAGVAAAEVSSHALTLHRVDCSRFAVAAFTNLSQDHLDFHGDMDAYYAAKRSLFDSRFADRAVVWVDDPAGRRLADSVDIPLITVGSSADVSARGRRVDVGRSTFMLVTPDGERRVQLRLGGDFNVDNALVAAGCAVALGIDEDAIAAGLAEFEGVPGRFEVVSGTDPIEVMVDYAHTPASIATAIGSVRETAPGTWASDGGDRRLIVLFGAGGDRDTAKRPQMGTAAMAADVVIVTSDNPRSEDPTAIIDQIMSGIDEAGRVARIVDRREAINHAVAIADDGDVVLILGRGHERGQEVEGRLLPFDDRLVARDALSARRRDEA